MFTLSVRDERIVCPRSSGPLPATADAAKARWQRSGCWRSSIASLYVTLLLDNEDKSQPHVRTFKPPFEPRSCSQRSRDGLAASTMEERSLKFRDDAVAAVAAGGGRTQAQAARLRSFLHKNQNHRFSPKAQILLEQARGSRPSLPVGIRRPFSSPPPKKTMCPALSASYPSIIHLLSGGGRTCAVRRP